VQKCLSRAPLRFPSLHVDLGCLTRVNKIRQCYCLHLIRTITWKFRTCPNCFAGSLATAPDPWPYLSFAKHACRHLLKPSENHHFGLSRSLGHSPTDCFNISPPGPPSPDKIVLGRIVFAWVPDASYVSCCSLNVSCKLIVVDWCCYG